MRQIPRRASDATAGSKPRARGPVEGSVASDVTRSAADEWDALATALNAWGVKHVAPARPHAVDVPREPRELFERLTRSGDPRLRESTVVLLLTHPHLAAEARAAIDSPDGALRDRAMRGYVAAAALQRMARTRIELSLGPHPDIPPAYLDELGLPPLEEDFGRETLLALAADEERRYGYPAWRGYRGLLDQVLAEIRRRGWGKPCGSASTDRD